MSTRQSAGGFPGGGGIISRPGRLACRTYPLLGALPEMSPELLLVVAVAAFTVLVAIIEWSSK